MMEALRKSVGSWVAKVFIGLLVVSFAVWGIGDIFRGASEQDVVVVGSSKVTVEEFRDTYQQRLQQIGRQFGRSLTPQEARSFGIDRQVVGEVISERSLDQRAREMGLRISDEQLIARIHANPLFQGPNNTFDRYRFEEQLRVNNYTEPRYIDAERRLVLRQQLVRALSGDTPVPATLSEAVRSFQNEERAIELVRLGREQAGEIPDPSAEQLAAYFEERKASFRAPEYRKLAILSVTPETLAGAVKISDEDVRQEYEAQRDRIAIPERREIQQIVFPTEQEAEAARKRIDEGATFDQIVEERKLKAEDVSLGLVARNELFDKPVADAAFSLEAGGVSQPLPGRFGTILLRVSKIEPGKEQPFEEVSGKLREALARDRAARDILDYYDKVEDDRAGGSTLAEIAQKHGLKVVEIEAVDRSGRGMDGKAIEGLPGARDLLQGAFDAAVGVETDPIEIGQGEGYVWYEVAGITPSRDHTLEEVRDRVLTRWRDEEIAKRLEARAEEIRSAVEGGQTFAQAAPQLTVETREKMRRGQTTTGISNQTLSNVFQTAEGKPGIGGADDGIERIVFRVTSVEVPPSAGPDNELQQRLAQSMQDDLLVQYVMRLQSNYGVVINETALQTVTGGGDSGI